jgi:hypothetical protein
MITRVAEGNRSEKDYPWAEVMRTKPSAKFADSTGLSLEATAMAALPSLGADSSAAKVRH